jgi:hypothetical protein
MAIRVDCASGAGGEPEPAIVWFGARPVAVRAILDRWWGADRRWWKVQTDEGPYVLRRDGAAGPWELAAVARADDGP